MNRSGACAALLGASLLALPALASARALGVEVWTDRGNEAVYQPGDEMKVKVRVSDDSYLLVYEIDSEGYVRLLLPYDTPSAHAEAHATLEVPPADANVSLVVEKQTGESYIVAIAATDPFKPLPAYLRPYNPQAEELGYEGQPGDDDQGVTSDGKIVGDPFVAMERIRRRVVSAPDSEGTFGSAYTTYYVHQAVRYPRYLCNDCHRPDQWAWWDGYDPYYTTCSVFSVRINWGWYWGPGYWYGCVPYYVYTVRPDCPPRYQVPGTVWYSSWDGWSRWNSLWGQSGMRRYKTPPPVGYIPPERWKPAAPNMPARPAPPGYLLADHLQRRGGSMRMPAVNDPGIRENGAPRTRDGGGMQTAAPKTPAQRSPAERPRGDGGTAPGGDRPTRGESRPDPVYVPVQPRDQTPTPRDPAPAPREERPRDPAPAPQQPERGESRPPRSSMMMPGSGWGRQTQSRQAWTRSSLQSIIPRFEGRASRDQRSAGGAPATAPRMVNSRGGGGWGGGSQAPAPRMANSRGGGGWGGGSQAPAPRMVNSRGGGGGGSPGGRGDFQSRSGRR